MLGCDAFDSHNGISHTYIVRLIYIRSSYIAENSLVRAEVYLFSAIFVHTAHPSICSLVATRKYGPVRELLLL